MKHLPFSDIWIGTTKQLRAATHDGYRLVYEIGETKYDVQYAPRSKWDPSPWLQIGGSEFRLKSTEIHAKKTS